MQLRAPLVALLLLSLACGTTETKPVVAVGPPPDEASPGFRLPGDTRPVDSELQLDLDPSKETFTGTLKMKVQLDVARRTLWLHARRLDVTRATVAGMPARFAQVDDDGMARLALDSAVGPGVVDVEIAWTAKYNPALESAYRVRFEDNWYVFTQMEAISAREAFPCFDEPGFKAPWKLSVTTPTGNIVVANTTEATRDSLPDGRTRFTFEQTKPLPAYLVAFAAGPFDVVSGKTLLPTDIRKNPLPLRGIAPRGKGAKLAASLDVTAEVVLALESWFGLPYAFDKLDSVAVPDFSAGAMENAGLITYRDALLYVDKTSPIGMQKANVGVIAHEVAHQWFGNYVTMAWWDDLWLNEAFASWVPIDVLERIRPELQPRTAARAELDWVTNEDSLASARQIRQPIVNKGDIGNAFDGITYDKGQSVIAMFESHVGAATFQKGVRDYLTAHAYGNATSKDLLAAVSAAAGRDITPAFSSFLDQPGVPFVAAKLVCDSAKKTATLELQQSRYLPVGSTGDKNLSWQIPVCARYDDGAKAKTTCTLLTSAAGSMVLDVAKCPAWVHPNADGLGYYRWTLPDDQLKALSSSLTKLSAGERISLVNALKAGFGAGTISYSAALDAALPLARDEEPSLIDTALELLTFARYHLVDPPAREAVQKKILQAYQPVVEKVGFKDKANEDPRIRERRVIAISALAVGAEDPKTLETLATMGNAVLGLEKGGDKKTHIEKAPSDLVSLALGAAIRAGGAPVWEDVQARLSTESDSLTRRYLLGGLASVVDDSLAAKARELALDPRLKVNEVLLPLGAQIGNLRTRDATWSWVPSKFDALVARLPEEWGDQALTGLAGGFCSEERAREVDAFFSGQPKKTPGMERALAQTLEGIRLCAAKKAVHEANAKKLFTK